LLELKQTDKTIRTFPEVIDFIWQPSEEDFYKKVHGKISWYLLIFQTGKGAILNKKLYHLTTFGQFNKRQQIVRFVREFRKIKIVFTRKTLFVNDIWSTGPYHFYVDVLSKLKSIDKKDFLNLNIVLFDDVFIREKGLDILTSLGYNFKRIILISQHRNYIFIGKNGYVPIPHIMGSCNFNLISQLQSLIAKKFTKFTNSQNIDKVYYYRKNRQRRVLNDNEIIPLLESKGFFCTTFDDLSYLEAFAIMNSTTLFVGIHGGGLTNMIFMKSGGKIVEIKTNNSNPHSQCYRDLSKALDLDYWMFVAQHVGESNVIEGNGCDVIVSKNSLLQLLDLKKE